MRPVVAGVWGMGWGRERRVGAGSASGCVEPCHSRRKAHVVHVFPLRAAPLQYRLPPAGTCSVRSIQGQIS